MPCTRLLSIVSLVLLILCACGCGGASARPNVIILVMDTTRADRCSVNGYDRPTTPALEKLAAEGVNFRNTWSTSGWTGPSHASIFTGLLPENHGFRLACLPFLDKRATTLAERLGDAGYSTGCFSNNPNVSPECGLDQGFDLHVPLYKDGSREYPYAPATHRMALDWVRKAHAKGETFFLFINDMEPHSPYLPPPDLARNFVDRPLTPEVWERARAIDPPRLIEHNLRRSLLTDSDLELISGLYDAEIASLDREIGHLVNALREDGILDDTLLIIVGDHGENLGDHGFVAHMFSLHRAIRHVPLVIRFPGGQRAGEVTDEVVSLVDIFPTVLQVCGLPLPAGIDGQPLIEGFTGRAASALMDPPMQLLERFKREGHWNASLAPLETQITAVFDGRRHRIQYSDGRELLFDIIEDPEEQSPLSDLPQEPLPENSDD